MAKRSRRVPRYQLEDPGWREANARRQAGIPHDAIPADLREQVPANTCVPPRFYRDYEFTCADCGSPEIWTAAQQKWWYEVAKGPIYSRAIRCRACREARDAARQGTPRKTHLERRLENNV
jgi:hypothetical protein